MSDARREYAKTLALKDAPQDAKTQAQLAIGLIYLNEKKYAEPKPLIKKSAPTCTLQRPTGPSPPRKSNSSLSSPRTSRELNSNDGVQLQTRRLVKGRTKV